MFMRRNSKLFHCNLKFRLLLAILPWPGLPITFSNLQLTFSLSSCNSAAIISHRSNKRRKFISSLEAAMLTTFREGVMYAYAAGRDGWKTQGPVSRKSWNFSSAFRWLNSLCIFNTKASWGTTLCSYFNFYSLYNIWKDIWFLGNRGRFKQTEPESTVRTLQYLTHSVIKSKIRFK